MIRLISLLCILFFYNALWAGEKYLVVIGGGGEPVGESTIFDNGLSAMVNSKAFAGYKKRFVFNGGHRVTDSILHEAVAKSNGQTTFNPASNDLIEQELDNILKDPNIKAPAQIFLTISSHGIRQRSDQLSHSVATSFGEYDLDKISEFRDRLAKEKPGVKLAIYDDTCYSGNSLNLSDDKTCVMTSGADSLVSRAGMIEKMFNGARPGQSIENWYNEQRAKTIAPTAPQISSPVGEQLRLMFSELNKSMVVHESDMRAMPRWCNDSHVNLSKFLERLKDIVKYSRKTKNSELNAELLKVMVVRGELLAAQVENYKQAVEYYQKLVEVTENKAKKTETVPMSNSKSGETFSINWGALATRNFDAEIESLQKSNEPDKNTKILYLQNAQAYRTQLLQNNAEFAEFILQWGAVKTPLGDSADLYNAAYEIMKTERDMYKELYKALSQKNYLKKKKNPCADFKI